MLHLGMLLSNFTQKTLQTAFLSDEKIFKVKKLYNSHNDVGLISEEKEESGGALGKIILRNWSLSQANNGFCGDIER